MKTKEDSLAFFGCVWMCLGSRESHASTGAPDGNAKLIQGRRTTSRSPQIFIPSIPFNVFGNSEVYLYMPRFLETSSSMWMHLRQKYLSTKMQICITDSCIIESCITMKKEKKSSTIWNNSLLLVLLTKYSPMFIDRSKFF